MGMSLARGATPDAPKLPSAQATPAQAVPFPVFWLLALAIPAALIIAMLRFSLFDVNVLINSTLVYGTLTAVPIFVYVGSVVLLHSLFRAVIGSESQLAIVALFNPLRRRIQGFVGRRFYRSKYGAAKTLEAFSAKLRDETDLDALSGDLMAVVGETMQPAHVSLWLRPMTAPKCGQTE